MDTILSIIITLFMIFVAVTVLSVAFSGIAYGIAYIQYRLRLQPKKDEL